MTEKSLSTIIIEIFGERKYKKAQNFSENMINIIKFQKDPLEIRAIILENERELHLIIDEDANEIYHDCPNFLIHMEQEDKICPHFLKLLLILDSKVAKKILKNMDDFKLTSEDFGSFKKSKNYLIVADSCFQEENPVEGLNFLQKAIINKNECQDIIETYFKKAIENDLYIEFFEFLNFSIESDLEYVFSLYSNRIYHAFSALLDSLNDYSFYNILKILDSTKFIPYLKDNPRLFSLLLNQFSQILKYRDFKQTYFVIYFIRNNYDFLADIDPHFKDLISEEKLITFQSKVIEYFTKEIESFSIFEKIKLLKSQFPILGINKKEYIEDYEAYKEEIKQLERKVLKKKFSFLKLLLKKYKVKRVKAEIRKKRNFYVITHDKENLKKAVYHYIIDHLGFYGPKEEYIKSNKLGENFFLIKELFSNDLNQYPDILYYKNQYWGEDCEIELKSIDGYDLINKDINYHYKDYPFYKNQEEIMIIEWDLIKTPRQANIVSAYSSQIIVPDQNNPLFHDLKPFDLCICKKTPISIESNIIKKIQILNKCTFEEAIQLVGEGVVFIEGYYPLSLIQKINNREINPFDAYYEIIKNPNREFIPNYKLFVSSFKKFLTDFIDKEREYVFEQVINDPEKYANQILLVSNFYHDIKGIDMDFTEIIKEITQSHPNIDIHTFRKTFIQQLEEVISTLLAEKKTGSTSIFNLKKMKNTPFSKYFDQILEIRRKEFQNAEIKKIDNRYNVSEILETYYGQKFSKILDLGLKKVLNPHQFVKMERYAQKLDLNLNIQ
ncbi:MAG: hypothetical protein ACOC4M_01970 [Promethearchaeia archaeon]